MKPLSFHSMFFLFIITVMHISVFRLLSNIYGIAICLFLIVLDVFIGNYLFDYVESYKKTQILFCALIIQVIISIAGMMYMKLDFLHVLTVVLFLTTIPADVYPMIEDRSVWQQLHDECVKNNFK